jgi:hypothetical protein
MAAPFYNKQYEHNGSIITVLVERNAGTVDLADGSTVTAHRVTGSIDGVERINDLNPFEAALPYTSLANKIAATHAALEAEAGGADEFDTLMDTLGYSGGSEAVTGYMVTETAPGELTHEWDFDNDFVEMQIENGLLPDYSDAYVTHGGALADPIVETGYPSGVTNYFRIHGRRDGEDWGPWSYASVTTA